MTGRVGSLGTQHRRRSLSQDQQGAIHLFFPLTRTPPPLQSAGEPPCHHDARDPHARRALVKTRQLVSTRAPLVAHIVPLWLRCDGPGRDSLGAVKSARMNLRSQR